MSEKPIPNNNDSIDSENEGLHYFSSSDEEIIIPIASPSQNAAINQNDLIQISSLEAPGMSTDSSNTDAATAQKDLTIQNSDFKANQNNTVDSTGSANGSNLHNSSILNSTVNDVLPIADSILNGNANTDSTETFSDMNTSTQTVNGLTDESDRQNSSIINVIEVSTPNQNDTTDSDVTFFDEETCSQTVPNDNSSANADVFHQNTPSPVEIKPNLVPMYEVYRTNNNQILDQLGDLFVETVDDMVITVTSKGYGKPLNATTDGLIKHEKADEISAEIPFIKTVCKQNLFQFFMQNSGRVLFNLIYLL